MCLVALALDIDPRFPLVVATNRDEFRERPTAALNWWRQDDAAPEILAGRDLRDGGTWLGLNRAGRFALLTNIRDPGRHDAAAPSRGHVVPLWLRGELPIDRFWTRFALSGHNGCNVIAADFPRGECFWAANDGSLPRRLEPGLYGLSNASLDTPWPKTEALKRRVRTAIAAAPDAHRLADALFEALADRRVAADDALPSTGVPPERERALSAAFIDMPEMGYGTRSSTLLIGVAGPDGRLHTHVFERSFDAAVADPAAATRHVELPDWPPRPAGVHSERTISTWGMPASSNTGPRAAKPARS